MTVIEPLAQEQIRYQKDPSGSSTKHEEEGDYAGDEDG